MFCTRRTIGGLALLALVGPHGCDGGGATSGGGGMNQIMWPDRGGGMSTGLPPSVETGRVVFESQSGETCCVAVDAPLLSGQQALAILTDLPVGPATVTVAGFSTEFAPTVAGIVKTCTTAPPDIGAPCDTVRVAAPAFESAPIAVTILAGVQTNLGDVPMEALPFLLDFSPAQDANAPAPVQFALTVVDAVTNIRRDSVELEVIFTVPADSAPIGTTPSPFRTLSKRVPLDLDACADGAGTPCSPGGALQLSGFLATGTAPELPEGPVEAHFTAANLAEPPKDLDFRYTFNVLATPTETATPPPTATPDGSAASAGSNADDRASASAGGAARRPSASAGGPPALPEARSTAIPPTPTATPNPAEPA